MESAAGLAKFQERIRGEIRATAAVTAQASVAPQVTSLKTEQMDGYRVERCSIRSEPGVELSVPRAHPRHQTS